MNKLYTFIFKKYSFITISSDSKEELNVLIQKIQEYFESDVMLIYPNGKCLICSINSERFFPIEIITCSLFKNNT